MPAAQSCTCIKSLTIAHINICSLRNKTHEIHCIMYKYRIDVLAISETCLDSTVMNCDLAIPAYTLYRRDRADRRKGGGVAMYVQEQLKSRQLQVNDRLETIFVGLHTHSRTNPFLSIGCVYRAPDSHVDFWEQLDNSVQMASATCPDILLLGDYNVNMLSVPPHPNARYVQGLCADHSLQNVILQPTRVPSQSCLDLALIPTTMTTAAPSSSPMSLHSTFVHSVDGLSDHHLIGLSVRVSRANFEQPHEQFSRRRQPSLAHLDRSVTSAALKHILDPSDVSGGYTLNAAASHWQQSVMTVLDDLAPFVTHNSGMTSSCGSKLQDDVMPLLARLSIDPFEHYLIRSIAKFIHVNHVVFPLPNLTDLLGYPVKRLTVCGDCPSKIINTTTTTTTFSLKFQPALGQQEALLMLLLQYLNSGRLTVSIPFQIVLPCSLILCLWSGAPSTALHLLSTFRPC